MNWLLKMLLGLATLLFLTGGLTGCQHEAHGKRTFRITLGSPFVIEIVDGVERDEAGNADYSSVGKIAADPLTDWLFKPKADDSPEG